MSIIIVIFMSIITIMLITIIIMSIIIIIMSIIISIMIIIITMIIIMTTSTVSIVNKFLCAHQCNEWVEWAEWVGSSAFPIFKHQCGVKFTNSNNHFGYVHADVNGDMIYYTILPMPCNMTYDQSLWLLIKRALSRGTKMIHCNKTQHSSD